MLERYGAEALFQAIKLTSRLLLMGFRGFYADGAEQFVFAEQLVESGFVGFCQQFGDLLMRQVAVDLQ